MDGPLVQVDPGREAPICRGRVMPSAMDDELLELRAGVQEKERLGQRLEKAQLDLENERTRLAELQAQAYDEARDVHKLRRPGLTALVAAIRGGREQQIAQEEREFLAAQLRCEECEASVAALEREVARMRERLAELGDVDGRYQHLLDRKAELVAEEDRLGRGRIEDLTEEVARNRAFADEVRQALEAGNEAVDGLRRLRSAMQELDEEYRLYEGGGRYGGIAAARDADEAAIGPSLSRAQHLLRCFQREVAGVTGRIPIGFTLDVDAGAPAGAALIDRILLGTGPDAHGNMDEMMAKVEGAVGVLGERLAELLRRGRELEEERRSAIERA